MTARPGAADVAVMKRCRKRRWCRGMFLYALSDQNKRPDCARGLLDRVGPRLEHPVEVVRVSEHPRLVEPLAPGVPLHVRPGVEIARGRVQVQGVVPSADADLFAGLVIPQAGEAALALAKIHLRLGGGCATQPRSGSGGRKSWLRIGCQGPMPSSCRRTGCGERVARRCRLCSRGRLHRPRRWIASSVGCEVRRLRCSCDRGCLSAPTARSSTTRVRSAGAVGGSTPESRPRM